MATTAGDIVAKFPNLLHLLHGDPDTPVTKPCAISTPEHGCIVFVPDRQSLETALRGPVAVLAVDERLAQAFDKDLPSEAGTRVVLAAANVDLAMARVCRTFFPVRVGESGFDGKRIHPSAVIAVSALIGEDTVIGPCAVIGANARIGRSCIIGGNSHIEAEASVDDGTRIHPHVDDGTRIHPHVFIAHGTVIGKNCEVQPMSSLGTEGYGYAHDEEFNHYRHVHYGRLVIEDDVHIGAGVFIDRGRFEDSVIGRGTKIDNYCHLAHNVRIGRNCLITGGFAAAGSVTIGDNNVFGGRASVTDHVTLGDNMQFAGLSAIGKDVDEPGGRFGGYPLQPVAEFLKANACIAKLPRMRKDIDAIKRKLGMK